MADLDKDAVAARAFALYVRRGRQPGRAIDDWLEAERQLRAEAMPLASPATGSLLPVQTAPKTLQAAPPAPPRGLAPTSAPALGLVAPASRPIPPPPVAPAAPTRAEAPRPPPAPGVKTAAATPPKAAPKSASAKKTTGKGKKRH